MHEQNQNVSGILIWLSFKTAQAGQEPVTHVNSSVLRPFVLLRQTLTCLYWLSSSITALCGGSRETFCPGSILCLHFLSEHLRSHEPFLTWFLSSHPSLTHESLSLPSAQLRSWLDVTLIAVVVGGGGGSKVRGRIMASDFGEETRCKWGNYVS